MSITGPGSITAANLMAQTNMFNQLNTLSEQLGTGEAAQTYSGLGSQAGVALELGAQLSAINGYSSTATTVGTTLSVAQSVFGQLADVGSDVSQSITGQGAFTLDSNGQTTIQQSAASYLDQIVSLLNTQVGGNYLFSGSAVNQPSVASTGEILNGTATQAGLTQVIPSARRLMASARSAAWSFRRRRRDHRPYRQPGCHRFAVRLPTSRRQFEPDRRDRNRPIRPATVGLDRSRLQSE